MKLVAGLGNPGSRYEGTRHNMGYAVVDELARRWKADVSRYDRDFEGLIGEARVADETVRLLKPATYMNLSGRSVAAMARFYRLSPADLLIVSDDLDLPVGAIRVRARGSAGGQKGLADVIRCLGTEEIARLRVGIGRSSRAAAVDHVLSRFDAEEREALAPALGRAADAVECWVRRGVEAAMNEFNAAEKPKRSERPDERRGGASGPRVEDQPE